MATPKEIFCNKAYKGCIWNLEPCQLQDSTYQQNAGTGRNKQQIINKFYIKVLLGITWPNSRKKVLLKTEKNYMKELSVPPDIWKNQNVIF